jgi:hypothetical protein
LNAQRLGRSLRGAQMAGWMIAGAVSRYDRTVCERLDAQRRMAM